MKRALLLIVAIALPLTALAAAPPHQKTGDQDCVRCHEEQEKSWLEGKHGLMNVKCVVCHGDPEVNFAAKPGLDRCLGCHADAVADVRKKSTAKEQTCLLCHAPHTAAVKESAQSGFHREGGTP